METDKVVKLMKLIRLPSRMKWYEVDGKILFPLSIVDAPSADFICYLIRYPHHPNDKKAPWYKYGITLKYDWPINVVFNELQKCIFEFKRELKNVNTAAKFKINMNGGDLGIGDNRKTVIEEVSRLGYDLE